MAPEQLAGLPADVRSDFYALGLVLLEMLTGTTALETLTPLRLRLLAGQTEQGQRSEELRSLAALEAVIRRCLRLDRTDRYSGADDIIRDLRMANPESPFASRTPPVIGKPQVWKIALVLGLLLALVLGYWGARHKAITAAEARQMYSRAMRLSTPQSSESELREALDIFSRLVADRPDRATTIYAQIDVLIQLYERTQQRAWLARARSALDSRPAARMNTQERILLRARVDLNAGSLQAVIHALQNASALRSSSEDANLLLGRALAASGQAEAALQSYHAAVDLNPDSWAAHNDLGYALLRIGELKIARQEFTRVIALRRDLSVGYVGLGVSLMTAGDLASAHDAFELALARMPAPETYYNVGVTYFLQRHVTVTICVNGMVAGAV